jgi:hypothetical protein
MPLKDSPSLKQRSRVRSRRYIELTGRANPLHQRNSMPGRERLGTPGHQGKANACRSQPDDAMEAATSDPHLRDPKNVEGGYEDS